MYVGHGQAAAPQLAYMRTYVGFKFHGHIVLLGGCKNRAWNKNRVHHAIARACVCVRIRVGSRVAAAAAAAAFWQVRTYVRP